MNVGENAKNRDGKVVFSIGSSKGRVGNVTLSLRQDEP